MKMSEMGTSGLITYINSNPVGRKKALVKATAKRIIFKRYGINGVSKFEKNFL